MEMPGHDAESFSNPSLFSSTLLLPRSTQPQPRNSDGQETLADEHFSEFGGPEDFTEHLTEYMNGTRQWKPETDRDAPVEDTNTEEQNEESIFEPAGSSTPASPVSEGVDMPAGDVSPGQPSPSPLRNPKTRSRSQDADDTFLRVSELQAEVERMRQEEETRRLKQQELERENEELRKENEEAYQRFDEIEKLSQPDADGTQVHTTSRVESAEELRKADERIRELETDLQASQERVEHLQSGFDGFKEHGSDVVAQLKEELESEKKANEVERNKSLVIAREAAKLSEMKEQNETIIESMRAETDSMNRKYDHMYDELQETKRIMQDAEAENEGFVQEIESQKVQLVNMREQLQDRTTELRAAHNTIASLRDQLSEAQTQRRSNPRDDAGIPTGLNQNERTIAAHKVKSEKTITRLRDALQSATQSRQKSEDDLKRSHAMDIAQMQSRIRTLEQQAVNTTEAPSTHSIEDELRTAIRVLNTKLTTANANARASKAETAAAREELGEIQERNRFVNAELETRFKIAAEKREDEWHRRVELLFRERDRMGKALLREWGKQECGQASNGERQAYRYKYIKGRS